MIEALSLEEKVRILWRLNHLSDPTGFVHETGDMISTRDSEFGFAYLAVNRVVHSRRNRRFPEAISKAISILLLFSETKSV